MPAATIGYGLSETADRLSYTPICMFDTKGSKAKIDLDKETGCAFIATKEEHECDFTCRLPCT